MSVAGEPESMVAIMKISIIFEVCTVTVSVCSLKLSLIKLPTGNLMKLETTLKAC